MSYDGLEIDMLSLGDADCILLTRWQQGVATHILVDGGNAGSVEKVRAFLRTRSVSHIDHVVCSHPHDDHGGGLVELLADKKLTFGQAWLHIPHNHVNIQEVHAALRKTATLEEAQVIKASLDMAESLLEVIQSRGIPVEEPFQGKDMAFLKVCGPSVAYYEELVNSFRDADAIQALHESVGKRELIEAIMGGTTFLAKASDVLEENPETSPENNTSTILGTVYDGGKYLLTADAGAPALILAKKAYALDSCRWMQLPHHGSRRNITPSLIEYFRPERAFVSAKGNDKHPRRAVVNAFKKLGTKVYSTHYPNGGNLWEHHGNVPARPDYNAATPLWEADSR